MYDQGQYTANLYHQIDADGFPVIVRGTDPKNYVAERDQTFNEYTILQIDESQFTHVPQEKLHQQNALVLPIAVEHLQYECFMIEQPQYVEPVTQMDNLMLLGALNPNMFGAGAGTSLLLWSRNRGDKFIRNVGLSNTLRQRELPMPMGNGVRVCDCIWALDTLFNFDKGLFGEIHKAQVDRKAVTGWSNIDTVLLFQAMVQAAQLTGGEFEVLKMFTFSPEQDKLETLMDTGNTRKQVFTELGTRLGSLQQQIVGLSLKAKLILWLVLPHASNQSEVVEQFELIMWMIAYSVVYQRWPQQSEYKAPELVGYPQGFQASTADTAAWAIRGLGSMIPGASGFAEAGASVLESEEGYLDSMQYNARSKYGLSYHGYNLIKKYESGDYGRVGQDEARKRILKWYDLTKDETAIFHGVRNPAQWRYLENWVRQNR